ncbi:MAG: hydroxypyruvate isomerase family protein [Beijerinckiaceae bacterium]|nr:hydroxypyruvate isomerase family protein [Beijerinckiaceae bacterium]
MPRFAANLTMMFNEVPFLERFGRAAAAGFESVEFLFPYEFAPEAVATELRRHGLTLALFNLPPGNWAGGERGIAALAGREDEFRQGLITARAYAEATGVRRVHMMAGLASPDDAAAVARYEAAIREAASFFAPMGIDVLLEPLNRRDVPGYLLDDFGRAAALIRRLGLPNVKLQFDIYHCQILHGDITMRLRDMFPIIGHIQTASIPLRNEPGSGELNDAAIFAELERLGYAGFIGCEYRPANGTEAGLGWFAPYRPRG